MRAENFTGRLDDLEEMATKLAISDDPAKRCYGRLILSGVAGRLDDFFSKEEEAGTSLFDLLTAVAKLSAEMLIPIILSAEQEHQRYARDLSIKVLKAYLIADGNNGGVNA